jgi:hypothetical protein
VFTAVNHAGYEFGPNLWTNDYRFENPLAQRVLNRACSSRAGRALVRWAAGSLPGYRGRTVRTDRVNVAFMNAVLEVAGARVFADTSKHLPRLIHLLRVPELELKIVRLIRDVRAYAASAKRRGHSVSDAAHTWHRDQVALTEIARHLPEERVHSLRYEDLCRDPAATLSRLWAFCGVRDTPPPEVVDATQHHVLGNSMRMAGEIRIRLDQSWKERLDTVETECILEIAGKLNQQLGYV